MGRLRSIDRTAVFAWSNGSGAPLMVTGTRTGALDDSFSSETKLELWDLRLNAVGAEEELKPVGSITTDSGFNDVAWSEPTDDHPLGVIAGALENGSVDLWDAEKLRNGGSDAFVSRTTKHSGAAKALQWNPHRHHLLASVGAKGEIFIYDLNNMANPFRLGATAARADDFECLDWNKQEKTAHILATGSSGGFVTVWDVKQKKDILTLNNQGRKAVSAVAWDPEESTKLATASSSDQEPTILLWSLRNSSAPERTLKGHELGVLGLSWCLQDPDLLLSCGKDNNTVCWNARTGEKYGDFAAGSNWAFQTRWNPHNPSLIASASFDGKILITSTQSTNSKPEDQSQANQALDDSDFFAKAQSQPQDISFTIPKAPRWAARPASVSFGFGGKLVRIATSGKKSKVALETFSVETAIGDTAQRFEETLKSGNVESILSSKLNNAKTDEEKADWQVIETLNTGSSRKKLREYLGFKDETVTDPTKQSEKPSVNGEKKSEANGDTTDDFFGSVSNDDSFLADLAATKGAKTNNPFSVYTGSESEADKSITKSLMLGNFESAMEACLSEDRMSDAFMIAVCGGQKCIDKVQSAYLRKQGKGGRSYLRILASVVGKNLWDVVHNADLTNWKEVMATLCTYADGTEFADLCEGLGDRLEEAYQADNSDTAKRRDASFCYLAGSKLEKVVMNWVQELREQEKSALGAGDGENDFSIHASCLQDFIEKVSVFRKVANFKDSHEQQNDDWKLSPLYTLYAEYADILAAHGQLSTAEQYLDLLPGKFNGAESAQQRIRQATRKSAPVAQRQQPAAASQRGNTRLPPTSATPLATGQPLINQARNPGSNPYAPPGAAMGIPPAPAPFGQNASQPAPYAAPTAAQPGAYGASGGYTPSGYQPPQAGPYGGYQPPQPGGSIPPPPRAGTASPSGPLPAAATKPAGDWNDMPANFFKQPTSRRGTPAPQPISSPFPNAPPNIGSPPPPPGPPGFGGRSTTPLPPPPRAGEGPPKMTSPPVGPTHDPGRPSSSAGRAYAPAQTSGSIGSTLPTPSAPPVARGASPYQPPPSTSHAAPSNRYAPAPGSQPTPAPGGQPYGQRPIAPNPYGAQPGSQPGQYAPSQPTAFNQYGQPPPAAQPAPPPPRAGPPPSGPPRNAGPPPAGPPRNSMSSPAAGRQVQLPQTAADAKATAAENATPTPPPQAQKAKYPRGDRSHIPVSAQPIVDLLTPEISRIKSVAPAQFKPQVDDMEKRIKILFDHLNNQDLLSEDTVGQVVEIAKAVSTKEWDAAMAAFTEMQTAKLESEGTHWMVGVKRLINIGKATKV